MTSLAPFSRLQLAAALLEYDNDLENPDAPYRSAQDSAIFAYFRRDPAARPEMSSGKSLSQGVTKQNDAGRSRTSRVSLDALRNPFGTDNNSEYEEADGEEEVEVDLASWGLDAFMPNDKVKSAKSKGKQQQLAVGSTRSRLPSTNREQNPLLFPSKGLITSKSISLGGIDEFPKEARQNFDERRRSYGSPLDLEGMEVSELPINRPRAISQASLTPSYMVPFPSTSIRSPSPAAEQAYVFGNPHIRDRTYSLASLNSKMLFEEGRGDMSIRQRNTSNDGLGLSKANNDNPFVIQNPSHISRFDPKTISRVRSYSNASLKSKMMHENDNLSIMTSDPYAKERRFSTLDLLRPKVLVMPSPLQPVSTYTAPEPQRNGFELSADGPPLPLGARSSRRLSNPLFESEDKIPIASNSFTPNPLQDLSLSQKTFRNTLIDGATSMETGQMLPRATEDGEQAELDPFPKEELLEVSLPADGHLKAARPPGKLYGKSLIDDLEQRKAQMRSKQRVFTGDQRPSMMARDQLRSSTLIDPASLQTPPTAQWNSSYNSQNKDKAQNLGRRASLAMKPLLQFDENEDIQASKNANCLPNTRSVFGVDTLWQREMEKLKIIQLTEERELNEMKKKTEEKELRRQAKKDKRKKKAQQAARANQMENDLNIHVAPVPPTLPDIQRTLRKAPNDAHSVASSESDVENENIFIAEQEIEWHAGSSEEDKALPRRTTGVGPRYSKQKVNVRAHEYNDSDDDRPLASTIIDASKLITSSLDSDEDKPLSHILQRAKSSGSGKPDKAKSVDTDEDQPLGIVRSSKMNLRPPIVDSEDDVPLAFHPEQQRRTQFQMLAQHQQALMQAQIQSNMLMNHPIIPSYYPAPLLNPLAMMQMQATMPAPSPPPMHDEIKNLRVDRWRRDVESENI